MEGIYLNEGTHRPDEKWKWKNIKIQIVKNLQVKLIYLTPNAFLFQIKVKRFIYFLCKNFCGQNS